MHTRQGASGVGAAVTSRPQVTPQPCRNRLCQAYLSPEVVLLGGHVVGREQLLGVVPEALGTGLRQAREVAMRSISVLLGGSVWVADDEVEGEGAALLAVTGGRVGGGIGRHVAVEPELSAPRGPRGACRRRRRTD